ncbi:MAG: hypothetical protein DCC75_13635, partial [Proteobacteria bacterium]
MQLAFVESFEPKTSDFRSQISRAFRNPPDTLLLLGLSPEIETLAKQLRELNKNIPLTSIEAFGLAQNKSAFNGSWYVDPAAPSRPFQERFKSKTGHEYTPPAAFAYDTVAIIAEAFEQTWRENEKPNRAKVAEAIHSIKNFKGVVGAL